MPSRLVAAALALTVVTGVAFAGVAALEFVNYDDPGYVTANRIVGNGLSWAGTRWAFTTGAEANWHPITWLSHMHDVELFGLAPRGHHLTSLAIHTLNGVLLVLLLASITGSVGRSFVVAAFFALHPLRVESVAWVSERKDVLSVLFACLAIGAYARWTRRPSTMRYVSVALLLVLGLMSKPMLVTLPFVLLLLDVWPLGRQQRPAAIATWWPLVREKVPLFALALVSSVVTLLVQHRSGAVRSTLELPVSARFGNAAVAYGAYVRDTFWPVDLACFYPLGLPIALEPVIVSAALVVLVSVLALWAGARSPAVLIGWLWFLGTLVPVLGIVKAGAQARADRFTYLPSIGLFIMIVWAVADLADRWRVPPAVRAAVVAGVLLVACLLTQTQVAYWRDSRTLFAHALAVTTGNHVAHANLGAALDAAGEHGEAIVHYREALRIAPTFVEVHRYLGRDLAVTGERAAALAHFEEALRLAPNDAESHFSLGTMLYDEGRRGEAIAHFEDAIRLRPDLVTAHVHLGEALRVEGRSADAKASIEAALRLDPGDAPAHQTLGLILADEGRSDAALEELAESVRLDPASADARFNLGNVLQAAGRTAEAVHHYERARDAAPARSDIRNNLGLGLVELGRVDESAEQYREAIRLAPDFVDPRINLAGLLRRAGRLAESLTELEAALRADPTHADAHYMAGNVLVQSERLDEAAEHYTAALAARPFAMAANNLGLVRAAQGRLPEAIGHYTEALALDPALALAYYNRSVARRRAGDVERAAADLAQARALDPRIPPE